MSEANVIDIATRLTEAPPIDLLEHRYDECRHSHVTVDDRSRTVACRDCGRDPIDPIEVLVEIARTWRRWQHEYRQLVDARRDAEQRARARWNARAERHLRANPTHRMDPGKTSWRQGECETCFRLSVDGRRWLREIASVPTPPAEEPA